MPHSVIKLKPASQRLRVQVILKVITDEWTDESNYEITKVYNYITISGTHNDTCMVEIFDNISVI